MAWSEWKKFSSGTKMIESGNFDISAGDNNYTITFKETYNNPFLVVSNNYYGYSCAIAETYPMLDGVRVQLGGNVNGWIFRTKASIPVTIKWYLFESEPTD